MKLSEQYHVSIYAVRERTALLVPVRGIKSVSQEARRLPWPPEPEELGAAVLELLDGLRAKRFQYAPEARGYWFQPGIRSWKAFQASSSLVHIEEEDGGLVLFRWDGRSERGFVPETVPCAFVNLDVGPEELGRTILDVLLPLVEKERG